MNRTFGIVATVIWLVLMAALLDRDAPFWRTEEPPKQVIPPGNRQTGIFDAANHRIGTSWVAVTSRSMIDALTVFDVGKAMPGIELLRQVPGLSIGEQLGVQNTLSYDAESQLDSIVFCLYGVGIPIHASARRYGSDFSCEFRCGDVRQTMSLPADASEYLGETLRPFTHLRGLHVGQTWRIRIIDPISTIRDRSLAFNSELVRVRSRERIRHEDRDVECFRIETESAIAWADDGGNILRQELRQPVLGRWTLIDEPYDAAARKKAQASFAKQAGTAPDADGTGQLMPSRMPEGGGAMLIEPATGTPTKPLGF